MSAEGQDNEQWKQKYYAQLDELEQKEKDWEQLESILKRTISRISLAAEGQNPSLDRHLSTLRQSIKNAINTTQLSNLIDEISDVITKLEEGASSEHNPSSSILQEIFSSLELPRPYNKELSKLQNQITNSDDSSHIKVVSALISIIHNALNSKQPDEKSGLLKNLFSSTKDSSTELQNQSNDFNIESYKACLLQIMNLIDNQNSPSGKLSSLKISTRDAQQQTELEALSHSLATFIKTKSESIVPESIQTTNNTQTQVSSTQPAIQELLIRLIEQLIVPADMQKLADEMKHRLEKETDQSNWKALLKDVTNLINSIRSRLQKEKNDFENFLQQVTDRLKEMDQFLQTETQQLEIAEHQGIDFDNQFQDKVTDIQQDINDATDIHHLKQSVTVKLDTISSHIRNYRDTEKQRLNQSQQQIQKMHNRMQDLEKETDTLKKVVIEKSKQAMYDTLTAIPNRLAYDKKIEEEFSRWKRFSTPLTLAIWDIDFFKKVNDTYGHKAGDKVLKTVAQLLNKRIRATDFLARFGGEEFVMLLPGTQKDEALSLLNKLREQVENCGFHYHGEAVTITASCGICNFSDDDTPGAVFERADQALYQAKKNGRNQCVIAP